MKDFPMFTTEFGIASLVLKEIPYRGEAYIIIQDTQQPEQLLQECVSFCRMCGAEKIYARGHKITENYPLHCIVYEMRGFARVDARTGENYFAPDAAGPHAYVVKEKPDDWYQKQINALIG